MFLRFGNRVINTDHVAEIEFNPEERKEAHDYPGVLLIYLAAFEKGGRTLRLEGKEAGVWWEYFCKEALELKGGK